MGSKFEHIFGRIGIEKGWLGYYKRLPFLTWFCINRGVRYRDGHGLWVPIFGTGIWWLSEPCKKIKP